ncbi:T9SS C-terminal target domain-containing protein [Dyadobacter fanqingshengii]|uniref:T9SS C-terminal target domain-containing protein n=1 Tax=Dyadobacter fanqingshengii TaxID=2906443 RepID=A0A9X1P8V8_9BACT|nr:T9SS C-terminal target domain-containing protein [Dyadobacter fanqingshengii]MCF0038745.1 T9SS C-terminal target domain-containing protein [Dyadobacter fanqingshengii]MCF2503710.1 T9SS C-terminal target domain-containing protein [Dyadobacter fanqingshengii]USJ34425.1 T9SS C-terminal target domain-containing protein [Dyadobacter fanqingshengii]
MKNTGKLLSLLMLGLTIFGSISCTNDDDDDDDDIIVTPVGEMKTVTGRITANTTWNASNQYLLSGFVYVESGVTLNIEAGTIIKGDGVQKGSLIILPGAKIVAVGTPDKPIIFTSNKPAGQRKAGDWGGLILLGKAPVNKPDAVIEGENQSKFGGTDAADNSGQLKYVRIEFAGIAYETDKEINGLTFGGVGSGTEVDYVQVSYSGDDSYEWFGGAVNAKHLIAYRGLDDDFDTDNGFSGNIQYGFILRDPAVADQAGDSNGFESDNDAAGSPATPQTSAKFANVTIAMAEGTPNAKFASAMRIRRNSAISVYNTLVTGAWPRSGVRIHDDATIANFTTGKIKMDGNTVALTGTPAQGVIEGTTLALFAPAASKNKVAAVADLKLATGYNSITAKPGLLPTTGSALLTGGATLPTGFEANTVVGAFGATDWTDKWANWDPQNANYEIQK